MYADELNPEDLFNMFFGGGGGGGQFGNANGEFLSLYVFGHMTDPPSIHLRWEWRFQNDVCWRCTSSTTSRRRRRSSSSRGSSTNHHIVRLRPHLHATVPTLGIHGA